MQAGQETLTAAPYDSEGAAKVPPFEHGPKGQSNTTKGNKNGWLAVKRPKQTNAANLHARTAAGQSMTSENTTLEKWLNESGKDEPWNAIGYIRGRTGDGEDPTESSLGGADANFPKI